MQSQDLTQSVTVGKEKQKDWVKIFNQSNGFHSRNGLVTGGGHTQASPLNDSLGAWNIPGESLAQGSLIIKSGKDINGTLGPYLQRTFNKTINGGFFKQPNLSPPPE